MSIELLSDTAKSSSPEILPFVLSVPPGFCSTFFRFLRPKMTDFVAALLKIFGISYCFAVKIYIYAFSRRFYPKRLTIAFRLYIFISTCVPWESNPQPFAQQTQCSTTEPHRNTKYTMDSKLTFEDTSAIKFYRTST